MGCVKSKMEKPKKVCTCPYQGDTWLNKPDEGYHWEQSQMQNNDNYQRYLKDGAGCESAPIIGMVAVGGAGIGIAGVADAMGDAACGSGGAAAGCGAGGCGGCGGCGC